MECGADSGGKIRCGECKRRNKEAQQRRATRNAEAGLCRMCGRQPVTAGHAHCEGCLGKANAATRKHAAKRVGMKRCLSCGKDVEGSSRCRECLDRINEASKEKRRRYRQEGRCRDCGSEAVIVDRTGQYHAPGGQRISNYCRDCFFRMMASYVLGSRTRWRDLIEKLEEFGWKCAYTGEVLVLGENLSFDHTDPVCRFPEKKDDPANIEPVTLAVNLMKRHMTKEEFLGLVRLIAGRTGR